MAAQHNQRIMKNSPLATSMRFDCRWVELVGASHLDLLCRAVEADAEFALALGLAALCYSTRTVHQWSEPGDAARGVTLAGRAIAYLDRDDEAGLASTGRAVAINPHSAQAAHSTGWARNYAADPAGAIPLFRCAVRLGPRNPAAIVMPFVSSEAVSIHLAEIATQVSAATHAALVCDDAGWLQNGERLIVPDNITLLRLPPNSPELNATGNVWGNLRDNRLIMRLWDSYVVILDACLDAWNSFVADAARVASVTACAWAKVKTLGG